MSVAAAAAPPALERARTLVQPALRAAVSRLHPTLATAAGFHFGWTDLDGTPTRGSGGKAVRPALVFLAGEAAGGRAETVVPGAVAVELIHNFSLVHDDILDGDDTRRFRPTVWKQYGRDRAILTGDALFALALDVLTEVGPAAQYATRRLVKALSGLHEGQARDIDFEQRPATGPSAVTVDECLEMAAGKTAALLECATAIGAALAGAKASLVDDLARYGHRLGVAFQIVDDVLGVWGRPANTGKPVYSDLRRNKKALPLVVALAGDTVAARRLAALIEGGLRDEDDLRLAAELIEDTGAREFCERRAQCELEQAVTDLAHLDLDPDARSELTALAEFLVLRAA